MMRLILLFVLFSFFSSYAQDAGKVLIFIKEESTQLEYMLTHEVKTMREMLEESGFEVTTSTVSGKELKTASVKLSPDLKLSEANIDDYDGLVIPCMVVDKTTEETTNFVKLVIEKDKPIAAQVASVYLLAKAGALEGKKYALYSDQSAKSEFKGSEYGGKGIVQDGNIITSDGCPWAKHMERGEDRTTELSQSFINVIRND